MQPEASWLALDCFSLQTKYFQEDQKDEIRKSRKLAELS
jgi:hypothetical protein